MKHSLLPNKKAAAAVMTVASVVAIAAAVLLSKGRHAANANTSQGSNATSKISLSEATVDLSPSQLDQNRAGGDLSVSS